MIRTMLGRSAAEMGDGEATPANENARTTVNNRNGAAMVQILGKW